MPIEWDKIINYGVPLLLLAWIAYFVSRSVWPFVIERIKQSDKERDAFLTTLEEMKISLRSNTDVTIQTLKEVRDLRVRDEVTRERERTSEQHRRARE